MRGSEREKQVPRKKEADWLARERDGGMVEGEMGGWGQPPLLPSTSSTATLSPGRGAGTRKGFNCWRRYAPMDALLAKTAPTDSHRQIISTNVDFGLDFQELLGFHLF